MTEPISITMLAALERVCMTEGIDEDLISTTRGSSTAYGTWTAHEIELPNGRAVRVFNDDGTVIIVTRRGFAEVDRVTLSSTLRLDSILGAIVEDEVDMWIESVSGVL